MRLKVPFRKKAPPPEPRYPVCISDTRGIYRVPSATHEDVWYRVDLERQLCSCPAFTYRQRCPHLRRFANSFKALQEGKLR